MAQVFSDIFPLRGGRAHEASGAGATSFAAAMIGLTKGPVMWVSQQRQNQRLHPGGLTQFCDPGRLLFSLGKTHLDVLWIAEEALRSKAVPLVIASLTGDIDLTVGRRLQLAAEAGGAVGLFLLPEGMGSNAAETRWHCMPTYYADNSDFAGSDSTLFQWQCNKNKQGTNGNWTVCWNDATHHIDLVAQTGKRALAQAEAG